MAYTEAAKWEMCAVVTHAPPGPENLFKSPALAPTLCRRMYVLLLWWFAFPICLRSLLCEMHPIFAHTCSVMRKFCTLYMYFKFGDSQYFTLRATNLTVTNFLLRFFCMISDFIVKIDIAKKWGSLTITMLTDSTPLPSPLFCTRVDQLLNCAVCALLMQYNILLLPLDMDGPWSL